MHHRPWLQRQKKGPVLGLLTTPTCSTHQAYSYTLTYNADCDGAITAFAESLYCLWQVPEAWFSLHLTLSLYSVSIVIDGGSAPRIDGGSAPGLAIAMRARLELGLSNSEFKQPRKNRQAGGQCGCTPDLLLAANLTAMSLRPTTWVSWAEACWVST